MFGLSIRAFRIGLLWGLLSALPAGAPGAVAEPAHLPVGNERLQVRGLPPVPEGGPRPVNPLPNTFLLFESEEPLAAFDLDRGLSRSCRAGRFRQQRLRLYSVRLGGYLHAAVIGGRWGLYDPDRLAVPDLVYAMRWQDTGRCEVYVLRHLEQG
ncbi:hypothetical protein AAFN88_13470 [Pelagibius sp. CAU 1746]|uniref:hypothetical protein n=1 Tax=Pelagibius sp. CAU 1746 TaxID=3140370 RepID=UPI00325A88F7